MRTEGITIDASTLMIVTTIMISMMVYPDWLCLRISPPTLQAPCQTASG
jgi:hypothetical protein